MVKYRHFGFSKIDLVHYQHNSACFKMFMICWYGSLSIIIEATIFNFSFQVYEQRGMKIPIEKL
jgi:hypothetical protein